MPMVVKTMKVVSVAIDGSPEWKVPHTHLKTVDDDDFVKLDPMDFGLIKLILHGVDGVAIKSAERPSLRNLDGYIELMKSRNDLQASEFNDGEPPSAETRGFAALVGSTAVKQRTPKKSKRCDNKEGDSSVFATTIPDCDEQVATNASR